MIFIRESYFNDCRADWIPDKYVHRNGVFSNVTETLWSYFLMYVYSADVDILYLVYRQPDRVADHSAEPGAEYMNVQA
jgi:hypothetical protein